MSNFVSIKDKLREKIDKKINEKKQNKDPLFDNETFVNMKNSLSEKEKTRYDEIGKDMYENVNFETGEVESAIDTVSQLKIMLRSGLHPSDLTKEEKEFLSNYLGKEWYKEFGYLENDLFRINL